MKLLRETDELDCIIFVGALCEMLRSLRYIGVSVGYTSPRKFEGTVRQPTCRQTALSLNEILQKHSLDSVIRGELQECSHFVNFDWYYWDTP